MDQTSSPGIVFSLPKGNSSIIKVIGVGGGGNNALKYMYEKGINGVDFIICNTDSQTLDNNPIPHKVQLGLSITEGLGAGADPEVGEKAAIESIDDIKAAFGTNTKMAFITAGLGGGTGTGAAPVIAKVAKELGILTVAIVTIPFTFEGKRRMEQAENGLEKLRANVDSLIVINNDKLREQFGNLGYLASLSKADEVLANAAKGMAEVITGYFTINIDFRDARTVLQNSGTALMSSGIASGENKAEEAVKKALDSPLLNDNKITGAKNVLLLIRSGKEEITMDEMGTIMDFIQKEAGDTAEIIFGVGTDQDLGEAVSVLVIATGFTKENRIVSGSPEIKRKRLYEDEDRIQHFESSSSQEIVEDKTSPKYFVLEDDGIPNFTPNIPTQKAVPPRDARDDSEINVQDKDFTFTSSETSKSETLENKSSGQNPNEDNILSLDEDLDPQSFSFTFSKDDAPVSPSSPDAHIPSSDAEFKIRNAENPATDSSSSQFFPPNKPSNTFQHKPTGVNSTQPEFKNPTRHVGEVAPHTEVPSSGFHSTNNAQEIPPAVRERESQTIHTFPAHSAQDLPQNTALGVEEIDFEEFTFIPKPTDNPVVSQRRNKLQEFNARFNVTDEVKIFETIPAYRRKNIQLEENLGQPAEPRRQYLREEEGEMRLKENKFLNKDVD